MKWKQRIIWTSVVLLVGCQLVPLDRSNPPVTGEIEAPERVMSVLRKACYDCHSNEVKWPWYAWVAPVSFLVVHDVEEAREHLNFSEWDKLSPAKRAKPRQLLARVPRVLAAWSPRRSEFSGQVEEELD